MSRDRSEFDANGWLASLPPADDYGPPPTVLEALMGEAWEHLPLIVMLAAIAVTVVALATGVILTERLQGTDAAPVPASAPAACVQRADGQRAPAACARRVTT